MNSSNNKPLSRRNWLGQVTTASLGTGLLGMSSGSFSPGQSTGNDAGARVYNIRDFGAKGDGKTLDTKALQAAIDACNKDQGGIVLVPAGVFVTGTVELKSNVTLHIASQGVLMGTADGKQYYANEAIPLHGDSTLEDGNVGLLYAVKAENITIEGNGTIDGQGLQFRSPSKDVPPPAGISGPQRPYHLLFHQCKNLTVRDIFLKDSAFHSIRVIQSAYVKMEGLHIHSRIIHNSDGFHFISTEYVHVSNCDVQTQDDACALFGSCKFVTVSDCSFSTRWSVFRFGGGVAEHVTVSNCIIYQTYGCPIKLRCGPGSRFENISFSNIIMKDVTGPISIGLDSKSRRSQPPANSAPGVVRNISFNNIQATVVLPVPLPDAGFVSAYRPGEMHSCIVLNAMDNVYLENISFNDVKVTFPGGGTAEQAMQEVPKIAGEYFEIGTPPAYGIFARNVRGLSLQCVRLETAAPDMRPAVIFDHVEDAAVNGLSMQGQKEAASLLRFTDSADILLTASRVLTPVPVFLQVEGTNNRNIRIDGGDLSKAGKALGFSKGANEREVIFKG